MTRAVRSRVNRVVLHIGEPKTGTTFLQQVAWGNRAALARRGVILPGHDLQDHYRAAQDLQGIVKRADDPAAPWNGEWEILAEQAKATDGTALISHELFCAADAEHVHRAVQSLRPAEVHLVLTVRDMATLLPAEWQETVKHRNSRAWQDWLADVVDDEAPAEDRRRFWFWRVHDTLAILDLWAEQIGPERIHVITMPRRGQGSELLWQRFAGVLQVDPGGLDLGQARPNASLGLPETEFLRRLNAALPEDVPGWFYMTDVKETLAHRALTARARTGRLAVPPERMPWAQKCAEELIAGLQWGGYDLVGDQDELRPQPVTESTSQPEEVSAEQLLDAAVTASAALVVERYRQAQSRHPRGAAGARDPAGGGVAERIEATVARSPAVKEFVRRMSSRYAVVRRLRVHVWRVLERIRER